MQTLKGSKSPFQRFRGSVPSCLLKSAQERRSHFKDPRHRNQVHQMMVILLFLADSRTMINTRTCTLHIHANTTSQTRKSKPGHYTRYIPSRPFNPLVVLRGFRSASGGIYGVSEPYPFPIVTAGDEGTFPFE